MNAIGLLGRQTVSYTEVIELMTTLKWALDNRNYYSNCGQCRLGLIYTEAKTMYTVNF